LIAMPPAEGVEIAEPLWAIEWPDKAGGLSAVEPTPAEIEVAAPHLASYYNDEHNRRMLDHQALLSVEDVVGCYAELRRAGGRPLLLHRAGELMGDADVRHIEAHTGAARRTGELAIMIGARAAQGRGLGTRYAVMLHAFAFQVLALDRAYVSIIPGNVASRRLFDRLGYEVDDSPEARAYVDEASDVTMSVERAGFEARWRVEIASLRVTRRQLLAV
jgi:RimJ/RimL family protein N-acetyltransferase